MRREGTGSQVRLISPIRAGRCVGNITYSHQPQNLYERELRLDRSRRDGLENNKSTSVCL